MCNDRPSPDVTDCNFWDTANYEGDNGICEIDSITAISHSGIQGSGGYGASWNSSIGIDGSDNIDTDR